METLLDFATDRRLTILLVKERAKCCRRNRSETNHTLDKSCPIDELTTRKQLSRMMPPRRTWDRLGKSERSNDATDKSKITTKTLLKTITRDRKARKRGMTFGYLDEMEAFFERIRARLKAETITFETPKLMPIYKDEKSREDKSIEVTCRPLAVYLNLEDKIILALTSRYITCRFDRFLHENILSYRDARTFHGEKRCTTDFNDGVKLIEAFRAEHDAQTIYAFDCDIKKFYDIIPHQVVRDCFGRVLDKAQQRTKSPLSDEGRAMVMRVLNAYLDSYNFYTHALTEAERNPYVYKKVHRKMNRKMRNNPRPITYKLGWVDEIRQRPEDEQRLVGVPQGGALSLLVANFVLNDVDQALLAEADENRLFIRYCDDMILLHTDYDKCCQLMQLYEQSLTDHGLYYHQPKHVSDCSKRSEFWKAKSHEPFLWADGEGNSNRYIGFLGYEIRRDGRMRLRKRNIDNVVEKISRQRSALHRYQHDEKHSEEEYQEFRKKTIDKLSKFADVYKAFDLDRFKEGSQYRFVDKLITKRLGPVEPNESLARGK